MSQICLALRFACACAVALVLAACATTGSQGLITPASPSNQWLALAALPDWSGVWIPDVQDQFDQVRTNPVPWTPAAGKQVARLEADEEAGHPKGLFANCLPEAMPAWMLISHNAMEILFTPGRVTILGESDGNRLRRIYTDGRPHATDPDPSFHGDSIGHWEGATLVVDTVVVLPQTYIAISEAIGIPNNGDLHIVEHIHLAGRDTLADDLEITAPHVLTRPWKTTRRYARQRGAKSDIVEGVCLQGFFRDQTDANGDAVFVPMPQAEGGNPAPPPAPARK